MNTMVGFNKIKILLILFSLLTLTGWIMGPGNPIKKAAWLIGTWESKTKRGIMYEHWRKIADTEFAGKSFMLKDNDTIVFETVRLVQERDSLFYIPTVKNQNNDLPVRFASKLITADKMVFENPKHDFPQIITYTKIGSDSLRAEVSGVANGQQRQQTFKMRKVQ
jgi:hypothetical protein